MKLTDIKNSLNEISAIGGLKQVVKGNTDRVEGIKLSKEMAQAMIDWFNSSPYGRKYPKAAKARLNLSLGIMSVMGLDRYAKHKGAKEELKYIKTLSKAMRDNVNEGKFKVDDLVYNKRTKTVGIVRIADDKSGEAKTDADGNVNVDELEKYNPIKFKHQSKAKAAPSTQKEVSKRGLFNPFKSESVNEDKFAGWIAGYNGKKIEIKKGEAKDLYNAKLLAIKKLKVPKSKVGLMFIKPAVDESVVNEAKYDIGMARKGNGLTIYNKAEEENGDYKNVALIDSKGKIKYLDKKVPSKIKKQIEMEAKKMMEITKEGSMKLTDLLSEDVYVKNKKTGNTYAVKNADPSKHVPPSKDDIEKAKSDAKDEPNRTPSKEEPKKDEPKNDGPTPNSVSGIVSGNALNYAEEALGKIIPKSEDGVKYNDEFNKIKSERAQMEKEMDSAETTPESKEEIRQKYQDGRAEYEKATNTKNMQNFIDLIDGSPEELQKKFDGVMKEVNRLKDSKAKLSGDDLEDAEFAQDQLALSVGVLKYKIDGYDNDRNLLNHYNDESDSYDLKYYNKVKSRKKNESIKESKGNTMKLTDLLKESFEKGKVYSNPFHTPFVKENDMDREEKSNEMTNEQKMAFLEAVKSYKTFGESIYRKEGLSKVYESIRNLVESAGKNMVKETEGSFDGITVSRHVKRMNESFKVFEKTLREVGTLQQRLESSYDEIGETLGKYYEINELEEGNEFGAARAKAIANGDSDFSVDGKKYPVKSVDKDDKENAKKFANESKSMKLTSMLNESFGFGELPSEKLIKMKVSAKDMLDSVKNKKVNESEVVKEEEGVKHYTKDGKEWTGPTHKMPNGTLMTGDPHNDDSEKLFHKEDLPESVVNEGFATWEMRFADSNISGVKLSKKNVYKVKARNTVEAIKKAAIMAGLPKGGNDWLMTQTHSLKKIG